MPPQESGLSMDPKLIQAAVAAHDKARGRLEALPALLRLKLLPEIQRFDMHGSWDPRRKSWKPWKDVCVCVRAWHGKALDSAVSNPGLVASKADWAAVNEAMATSALTTVLKRGKKQQSTRSATRPLAH